MVFDEEGCTILFMIKRTKRSQGYLAVRVLIGTVGLVLSLVLHELFHILVHWGNVTHVNFFPKFGTVVEINVSIPSGYDLEGEEIAAYGITLLVILITTIILFKVGDSEDKRSSAQILFPKDKEMQKLGPSELLALSDLDEGTQPAQAPKSDRKRR